MLTGGGIDEIHHVKEMNSQNSIRLFSLNAFKKMHLDFLPNNLRSFGWSAYPLNSVPSSFSPWNLVNFAF